MAAELKVLSLGHGYMGPGVEIVATWSNTIAYPAGAMDPNLVALPYMSSKDTWLRLV